eukprot:COSAG01_NODE_11402_length_1943_cov_1.081887_1_plen_198_part_00
MRLNECGARRGITMEKKDTPHQSRKFRVLLVRESFFDVDLKEMGVDVDSAWDLEQLDCGVLDEDNCFQDSRLEQIVGGQNQPKGYKAYKRDRLLKLQTLKRLHSDKGADRLFLVGSVLIPAAEHHPEAHRTATPPDRDTSPSSVEITETRHIPASSRKRRFRTPSRSSSQGSPQTGNSRRAVLRARSPSHVNLGRTI